MKLLTMDNIHWPHIMMYNTGLCSHKSHTKDAPVTTFATIVPVTWSSASDIIVTAYLPCGHVVMPTPYDGLAPDVLTRLILEML